MNANDTHVGTSSVHTAAELGLNVGKSKVGCHAEVCNRRRGKNDRTDLVEDPLTTRNEEVPDEDNKIGKEHDGEYCP